MIELTFTALLAYARVLKAHGVAEQSRRPLYRSFISRSRINAFYQENIL